MNMGQDTIGVTENFQYHDNYIKENRVKLDQFGKFYRKTSQPLYLMKLEKFLDFVDCLRTDPSGKVQYTLEYITF